MHSVEMIVEFRMVSSRYEYLIIVCNSYYLLEESIKWNVAKYYEGIPHSRTLVSN